MLRCIVSKSVMSSALNCDISACLETTKTVQNRMEWSRVLQVLHRGMLLIGFEKIIYRFSKSMIYMYFGRRKLAVQRGAAYFKSLIDSDCGRRDRSWVHRHEIAHHQSPSSSVDENIRDDKHAVVLPYY